MPIDPEDALFEAERLLKQRQLEAARGVLDRALLTDPSLRQAVVRLGDRLIPDGRDAAFVCVEAAADAAAASGQWSDAASLLQTYLQRASDDIPALLKLVEICVDGELDPPMYAAQARLADAFVKDNRPAEARTLAEDLVTHDPNSEANIGRLRRILVMLGAQDPDGIVAERRAATSVRSLLSAGRAQTFESGWRSSLSVEAGRKTTAGGNVAGESPAIDRAPALDEPAVSAAAFAEPSHSNPGSHQPAGDEFAGFRDEVSRQRHDELALQYYKLAVAYRDMGMPEESIKALEVAVRSPVRRFEAAALLGRLYRERRAMERALEWFEHAAEAPAPTAEQGRALLYDLADTLENVGETPRALAVFLELEADAGRYRDVRARVERLAKGRAAT